MLDILLDLNVSDGGRRLALGDVQSAWRKLRMRASDLERGLQALVRTSDLSRQREFGDSYIVLNEKGHHRGQSVPNRLVPLLKYFEGWILGRLARRRQTRPPGTQSWRRTSDHAR